jgi:hypothetical protein
MHENGLRGNAFHPCIVEWAREGITVEKLKAAIAKARQRPGKERGVFGPEYLDPILHDVTKPAAQVTRSAQPRTRRSASRRPRRCLPSSARTETAHPPAGRVGVRRRSDGEGAACVSAVRSVKREALCENPRCRKVFAPFQFNQRWCSPACNAQAFRKGKAPAFAFDALMAVMGRRSAS